METSTAPRLAVLDVVRGFALTGILWMNLQPVTRLGYDVEFRAGGLGEFLHVAVQGRFIGLFAFLFGTSFALFLDSAASRTEHPRRVLLRRFAFLLVLGLLHAPLHPGEVLAGYAVAGIVLLLPLSYVRKPWIPVALGTGLVVAAGVLGLEPTASWVGLVVAGFGAARRGVSGFLERGDRRVRALLVVVVLLAALAVFWQVNYEIRFDPAGTALYSPADYAAGVLGAFAYGLLVVVAYASPLRRVLRAVFEPLGRMALSNYVGATLLALAASSLLDLREVGELWPILPLGAAILLAQWVFSRCWLASFRYGPLEWAWRCVSWWTVVPNRRVRVPALR